MNIIFRAQTGFIKRVRRDLLRPHAFAAERVGFITTRAAAAGSALLLLAQDYHPVADADYVDDPSVGAMLGQEALRKALDIALLNKVGIVHVHMHDFPGRLWFSRTDLREQLKFMPDFFKVRRKMPHAAVVLGPHAAAGRVWLAPDRIERITEFNFIGPRVEVFHSDMTGAVEYVQ
jgi:hypothetical protein